MDAIIGIFTKLGVDSTIFPLFIVFLIFFFVLKAVFFNKLQEILELRETKTTKLEGNANEMLTEADELEKKYKTKIELAYQEAQTDLGEKKNEILTKEKGVIQEAQAEVNAEYQEKRKAFQVEFTAKREDVMKSADSLAKNLVEKLTT